jgi:hypothetical protein
MTRIEHKILVLRSAGVLNRQVLQGQGEGI